jgi:hypothetical protein
MRAFLLFTLLVLISGCGTTATPPTLDGSSEEAFNASIKKVGERLPAAKRMEFGKAIGSLMSRTVITATFGGGDAPAAMARFRKSMTGKTADDVIAQYRKTAGQ